MITDRLKKIIFDKLNEDLSHVEMISHANSIWFIDRENSYWVLEFQSSGRLYWRWGFFSTFFNLFSLTKKEYELIISEWVESILNNEVRNTHIGYQKERESESVLNNSVTSIVWNHLSNKSWIDGVLKSGTIVPHQRIKSNCSGLKEVLSKEVTSTHHEFASRVWAVKNVLGNLSVEVW